MRQIPSQSESFYHVSCALVKKGKQVKPGNRICNCCIQLSRCRLLCDSEDLFMNPKAKLLSDACLDKAFICNHLRLR